MRIDQLTETMRFRLRSIDALRGMAIAGVVVFHLVWNLEFAGLSPVALSDNPMWLMFGRTLAGTFMLLVGVSLALAHGNKFHWGPFCRRITVVLVAALTITAATRLAFADKFIYFGILHAIVAASVLAAAFVRLPPLISVSAGVVTLSLPLLISDQIFNSRWLAWIGFAESPPPSNDYVPIFPWVGLTLIGLGLAKSCIARGYDALLAKTEPTGRIMITLGWLGRHSLSIYLIHQPILLPVVLGGARLLE